MEAQSMDLNTKSLAPQLHEHRSLHKSNLFKASLAVYHQRSDQPPVINHQRSLQLEQPLPFTAAQHNGAFGFIVVRLSLTPTLPCPNVTTGAVAILCCCSKLQVPTRTLLWLLVATAAVSCISAESLLPHPQGGIVEAGAAAAIEGMPSHVQLQSTRRLLQLSTLFKVGLFTKLIACSIAQPQGQKQSLSRAGAKHQASPLVWLSGAASTLQCQPLKLNL